MEKIEIIETENMGDKSIDLFVIIDRGNGEFTSMPKAVYDAQVEHLTEIPTPTDTLTPTQPDEADLTEGTN